jgi:hypothetical protein
LEQPNRFGQKFLGYAPYDIPVLASAGLLKPSGHPTLGSPEFFATATLQKLRDDSRIRSYRQVNA